MERISTHQFLMLGAGVTLGTTFFTVGSAMTSVAGRDGWMAVVPGFILGIPFGFMVLSLSEKYPNKNLIQISEQILGKWVGKSFGILAILIALYFSGLLLDLSVNMFSRSVLPLTPRWAFLITGLALILMMTKAGIEVLARFSEIVFPVVVIALLGTALLSIPRFERGELLPFLENGIQPVFLAMIKTTPWPLEFVLFLGGLIAFIPQGKKEQKKLKSNLIYIFLIAGFLDMIITLVQVWVFGPTEAARFSYGILTLGKMIEIARTISGVESVFIIVWMGVEVIKMAS